MFGEGLQDSNQPYKYNGKEFDDLLGLNMYDFHWRHYMADIGRTTTMDPHAENYYSQSPYSMFVNNPTNVIDPTGMDTVYVAHDGHMDYRRGGENDVVYVTNKKGNVISRTYGLGTLLGGGQRNLKGEGAEYAYLSVNNKENSKDVFEFLADNTSVEFGNSTFRNGDGSMSNYITTSHETSVESGLAYLSIDNELYNSALLNHDHSHPDGTPYPSGMPDSRYLKGDIPFVKGHLKMQLQTCGQFLPFGYTLQEKDIRNILSTQH